MNIFSLGLISVFFFILPSKSSPPLEYFFYFLSLYGRSLNFGSPHFPIIIIASKALFSLYSSFFLFMWCLIIFSGSFICNAHFLICSICYLLYLFASCRFSYDSRLSHSTGTGTFLNSFPLWLFPWNFHNLPFMAFFTLPSFLYV